MSQEFSWCALWTCAASLVVAAACVDDPSLDTAEEEIRRGTIVDPFDVGAPLYERAIVKLQGCTGTMVSPTWLVTAKRCGVTVNALVRAEDQVGQTVWRTVNRVVDHPRLDVTLARVSSPMPRDVTWVTPYLGTEASLEAQLVDAYGFGAYIATPSQGPCPSGTYADGAYCMTPSHDLRMAPLTATDAFAGTFWMPTNADGQTILAGDLGGPSFRGGKLAGVHSWWRSDLSGSGDVSVPAFRTWMIRTIGAVIADYDGDRRSDVGVWRPSNGTWYTIDSSTGAARVTQWGQQGDRVVVGDFDGDGRTDPAVWRPSNGTWYVRRSSDGGNTTQPWGQLGDLPAAGDYDGDGRSDIAVFRPGTGTWHVINSSTGGITSTPWGASGDTAAPGDFDGDGRADLAVWRPATATWYVRRSSDGGTSSTVLGAPGWLTAAGDFEGDGDRDPAVFAPATGTWSFASYGNGAPNSFVWGQAGDQPAAGDYDGDGYSDKAVFRPGTGGWHVDPTDGEPYVVGGWGVPGDVAITSQVF